MSPPRPITPRRSQPKSRLLPVVLLAFVGLAALLGYTLFVGELRLPFGGGTLLAFARDPAAAGAPAGLPRGTVAVLAPARALAAYTRLNREHVLDAAGLVTVPVVPDAVAANGLFLADADGVRRLLGRVLRRDKPLGFAFSEQDLLPEGTRPGLAAGIPAGQRGVWIDAGRVQGLTDLLAGDVVDLLAAHTPLNRTAPLPPLGDALDPLTAAALAATPQDPGQARTWVLARRATVVQPLRVRQTPSPAGRGQPNIVQEVFLTMAPDEVARLSQAMAMDVEILAAPRSARPGQDSVEIADLVPPDPHAAMRRLLLGDGDAEATFGRVELIRGGSRSTVTVRRPPTAQEQR